MAVRKRNTTRKRDEILDAATQAFVTVGYESASMDHIAEVARASKRTVYNHFTSKEVLFRAVIARFLHQSHELKQIHYEPGASLSAQLGQFADSIIDLTRRADWLGLVKLMTGLTVLQPELVASTMAGVYEERDTLEAWLEAATADGRLHVKQPLLVARTFWAALNGAFLMPAIYLAPLPPEETKAMKAELIAMLLARHGDVPEVRKSARARRTAVPKR